MADDFRPAKLLYRIGSDNWISTVGELKKREREREVGGDRTTVGTASIRNTPYSIVGFGRSAIV